MDTPNIHSLPTYPDFTGLLPLHRDLIMDVTSQQVPSPSDFNYHSLLAWNIGGKTQISTLNGSLVVGMPDYMTSEQLITVCGNENMDKTVNTLLESTDKLVYVPDIVIGALSDRSGLSIEEDRDNFDYIYDIDNLVALPGGGSNKGKRNRISKFQRAHGDSVKVSHMSVANVGASYEKEVMDIVDQWQQTKNDGGVDHAVEPEPDAIQRLLRLGFKDVLHISRICIENSCIGFSIQELLPDGKNALCHFQKVVPVYENADLYLTHEVSRYLKSLGCMTVNWEQDLGIPGLRYLKESYHPTGYLKKYSISPSKP